MPKPEESLENLRNALEGVGDVDLKEIGPDVLKKVTTALNRLAVSMRKMEFAAKSTFGKFEDITRDLTRMGVPLARDVGQGITATKTAGSLLGKLSSVGIPGLGKAASALAGPIGIASGVLIGAGKAAAKFVMEMTKVRMEMAKTIASTGEISNSYQTMFLIYTQSSLLIKRYGISVEEHNKSIQALISTGLNPYKDSMAGLAYEFTKYRVGLGLSAGAMAKSIKLLRQEYGITDKLLDRTLALVKGHKSLNMSTTDYLNIVTGLTQQFIKFGIGAGTVSATLNTAVESLGLGSTRAQAYTREMIGGPRGAGMGQRAWMSEQLGIGGGGLGGAAMVGFGAGPEANLGKQVVEFAKKEMGLRTGTREEMGRGGAEQWEMGAQIALFAKQFGLSERTVYEELGLPVRKQVDYTKKMAADAEEIKGKARENLKVLVKSRDILTDTYDLFRSWKQEWKAGWSLISERKHSGGDIRAIPKFQHGGEVPAILETGEYVNRRESVTAKTRPVLENINQYGDRALGMGDGGQMPSVEVNINIPALKELVAQAVERVLTENSHLLMFG